MKRTQARRDQLPPPHRPVRLATQPCCGCNRLGVTIVCMGSDARGAVSMAWCGEACARRDGWPGLRSERHGKHVPPRIRPYKGHADSLPHRKPG